MKSLKRIGAAVAAVCLLTVSVFAASPSGTWTFPEAGSKNGGENTLVLDAKDGKLAGTFHAAGQKGRAVKISAASMSGDNIRFSVERTVQKVKVVTKYAGKLDGDTISGKVEGPTTPGGVSTSRDWMAKRSMQTVASE
jgi:hypothetical protein